MEEFEYQSVESEEGRISWIWRKALSLGKKVLTAGLILSSAPLLVPPLLLASTIAVISSVPYCLFLANYAFTQKLLSSILPDTGELDKDASGFEDSKLGHGAVDEFEPWMALSELTLSEIKEDEEMTKESAILIEKIREEGRTDRGNSEKDGEKPHKVQDQPGKQQAPETGHEGELESTKTESYARKDEETSSNEPYDQAVSGPRGTGEEKPKNTTKKKRKTGRAGVQ